MKYNIKLCFINIEPTEGGKTMIFRKKKRIKQLEKENKMLKRTIQIQAGIITNQRLENTFNRICGGTQK